MQFITVNGGQVAYRVLGDPSGQTIVMTPGGRFPGAVPGHVDLAERLAESGFQVVIWDRPNSGSSEVQFSGDTESEMNADTLAGLVKALDLGPVVLAGGASGARDSLVAAIRHPEIARSLIMWSIVGGVFATVNLAAIYLIPSIRAVRSGGMEEVLSVPVWAKKIEANPANRERLLAVSPRDFEQTLHRWLQAFIPSPHCVLPGLNDVDLADARVPTMIVRGGQTNIDHPLRTSLDLHSMIDGSQLVDAPWREGQWEDDVRAMKAGQGHMFDSWVLLEPTIREFANR